MAVLGVLILAVLPVARAADVTESGEDAATVERAGEAGRRDGRGRKHGGKAAKKADDRWTTGYYVRPVAGVAVFSTGQGTSQAVSLGANAGVTFNRREWAGTVRAQGLWMSASGGGEGLDLRLGSFWGPAWEYAGVTAGADVFWNRYTVDGYEVLAPSVGIEFPLLARLGPREIHGLAGVSTALLADEARRVDWSRTDAFGFGHEFGWSLGAGATLGSIGLTVVYSRRTIATGTFSGWSAGANVRL